MNSDEEKAERLWQHLKIRDECLIVRISDKGNSEKVLIACDNGSGDLRFDYVEIPPDGFYKWIIEFKQPFTLVQQRNADGCFYVPDIDDWIKDEKIDY